ncbi:gluconate 2-dehydrogenase [Heterostelium album PN500]|uniref:Gluconate 2-dehydrogenase n=1 Tax=Heterostelium pallidum (strain ATCC 26659 / Pp 5 / PN500) TaxID=670386 RepID=D3BRT8_HETP5|nr:gluconate 2-dehydrogenase [Heterostelium album PN500]EFA76120.1 gluconate 2-dehydrogenase [Heterostelium album PN500]|eukprot:XP_020428254.1 gluconate 2-dehydrogenase [Heterostelium album PN500]
MTETNYFKSLADYDEKKLNIVFFGTAIFDDLMARLTSLFNVAIFDGCNMPPVMEEFHRALSESHGSIGTNIKFDKALLNQYCQKLRVISTISVGYDNFDVPEVTRLGIPLMNTPDVLTETCADTAFCLIMASARRLLELANRMKRGEWTGPIGVNWFGSDFHSKTLGILGMGRIGIAIARRAIGFQMDVLYTNRSESVDAASVNARRVDLDSLLKQSDFLVIAAPLTTETYHIIGKEQLSKMKNTAFLINIARGQLVDEPALVEALQNRVIAGAGLDVFEKEPLSMDSPLLTMDQVVALPHIGSATHQTRHAMAECGVNNLIRILTNTQHGTKNCTFTSSQYSEN